MSQGLGIACHKSLKLARLEKSLNNFYKEDKKIRTINDENLLQFQKDNNWYISIDEIVGNLREIAIEDFKEFDNAPEDLKEKIESYIIYDITYDNYEEIKRLIKELLISERSLIYDIWIDNGYGLVLNGKTFLSKLENDQNWDWRSNDLSLD